jgi:hypothetical protein
MPTFGSMLSPTLFHCDRSLSVQPTRHLPCSHTVHVAPALQELQAQVDAGAAAQPTTPQQQQQQQQQQAQAKGSNTPGEEDDLQLFRRLLNVERAGRQSAEQKLEQLQGNPLLRPLAPCCCARLWAPEVARSDCQELALEHAD